MRNRKEICEEINNWCEKEKGDRIKTVTLEVLLDIRDLLNKQK